MPNFRHDLESLVFASRVYASFEELLRTIAGFGNRLKEAPLGAVFLSDSHHQGAETSCLRDQLDASQACQHYLHSQLRAARDTLAYMA